MDPVAQIRKKSLADSAILSRAILDSFRKLNPRTMVKNPVMFVVEVGAVLTTIQLAWNASHHTGQFGFGLQITLWLWFTVLFANFAEGMAEGRGKAQADTLRKARAETQAHRLRSDGSTETVVSSQLRSGDIVVVTACEFIPGDGEVIEGVASVDESAITGESAPVIRESGGDRSAVTGGTRVLSDEIKVRITSNPGETFLDRMIKLVEGASRQKTPNEIALNILLAGLTIIFLLMLRSFPRWQTKLRKAGRSSYSPRSVTTFVVVAFLPTPQLSSRSPPKPGCPESTWTAAKSAKARWRPLPDCAKPAVTPFLRSCRSVFARFRMRAERRYWSRRMAAFLGQSHLQTSSRAA